MKTNGLLKIFTVVLGVLLFSFSLLAQDDEKKVAPNGITPGIQWDTVSKVYPVRYPEHLVGIRYDFAFTGVMITPDMGIKSVNSPINVAVLYTYYHPLWKSFNYFGIQLGVRYSQYGFVNKKYQFDRFEQTVSLIEIPVMSAFHVDLGKYFRILASIGPFVGYRFATTKENGFDCYDIRWDYGVSGGLGVAFRFAKILELHLEGSYHYSFSMLYHPEKMSSNTWIYSYPWQANISLGLHVKLK